MTKISTKVFSRIDYFLAFGFGSGLVKKAPGTFGTLAAIPLYLGLSFCCHTVYLIIVSILFLIGIFICNRVSNDLKVHDFSGIVWDEIVGFIFAMYNTKPSIINIFLGFILFRFFDILKPFPINLIDRHCKGGAGIMLDDLAAAIPTYFVLNYLVQ